MDGWINEIYVCLLMRRRGTVPIVASVSDFWREKQSRQTEKNLYTCLCVEACFLVFPFPFFIFRNNLRWRTNFRDGHFITVLLDEVVGALSLEVSPQYFPSTRSAEPLTWQLLSTPIRSPPPYLPYTPAPIDLRPTFSYLMGDGLALFLLHLFHTRTQE